METDFDFDIDLGDFSDIEIDMETEFENRYIKPPKTKQIGDLNLKYAYAKDMVIEKNERAYTIVNGSFYFGDFIEALIVEKNYHVRKMTISTLSMNQNNVDSLKNLIDGEYVDELNLIVSDFFFSHERQMLIPYIYENLDKGNKFQLAAARVHTKICQFETYCGMFIVIHGSANLRSSENLEQFCIEENETLYRFNGFMDQIVHRYKTINKSLSKSETWQKVVNLGATAEEEKDV